MLPILGLFVGIIAAMLGIGGGVFIVPALQLLPLSIEFSPQLAAGTSLTMIVFKAISSSSGYARQKRIDYKIGLLLATTSIPGAFVGAYLTGIIAKEFLILIFALFLLYVASRMIFTYNLGSFKVFTRQQGGWHRRLVDCDGKVFEYNVNVGLGLLLSFFGGISSGLLGLGGGSIMVSIMHILMNFPMHVSVATSFFIMVFTSMSGAATHLFLGNVRFEHAILLGVGIIFGAQLGAYLSKRMSGRNLGRIFGAVLFLVSIRMIWKYI